jgi:hypothetical protein
MFAVCMQPVSVLNYSCPHASHTAEKFEITRTALSTQHGPTCLALIRVKSLDVGDLDRFAPKQFVWHKKARSCFEASTFFHSFAAIAKAC